MALKNDNTLKPLSGKPPRTLVNLIDHIVSLGAYVNTHKKFPSTRVNLFEEDTELLQAQVDKIIEDVNFPKLPMHQQFKDNKDWQFTRNPKVSANVTHLTTQIMSILTIALFQKLGTWIVKTRNWQKKGELSQLAKSMLDGIGFQWIND